MCYSRRMSMGCATRVYATLGQGETCKGVPRKRQPPEPAARAHAPRRGAPVLRGEMRARTRAVRGSAGAPAAARNTNSTGRRKEHARSQAMPTPSAMHQCQWPGRRSALRRARLRACVRTCALQREACKSVSCVRKHNKFEVLKHQACGAVLNGQPGAHAPRHAPPRLSCMLFPECICFVYARALSFSLSLSLSLSLSFSLSLSGGMSSPRLSSCSQAQPGSPRVTSSRPGPRTLGVRELAVVALVSADRF